MNQGPIALVGSGEYLPVMQDIEANLIAGRGNKYVQIPTAAALEGENSLSYWIKLGIEQANRIGAQAIPLIIRNKEDANDIDNVKKIEGAGLIYLSGGNPHYLANTLRDSLVWQAIESAWKNGGALAGCSAGAMAIASHIPEIKNLGKGTTPGLAILPNIRVLPHFDRAYMAVFRRFSQAKSITVIGIDENTALVGGLNEWNVQGLGKVTVFKNGDKQVHSSGEIVYLD